MQEGSHPLTYLSVCSGIEAATVAWRSLGWKPIGFAEIDKFPSAVLAHHYPEVKNYGDFTKIELEDLPSRPDILVGGTPCQSFSVAGLRAGLADPRGNLTLEFARLAERLRTRWLVWENVPGVLSIDGGRTFGAFLGALGEIGYGFAYRVCDAQYAGVPQRRRRVFLVGHLGDWRRAAAVLFERQSLSGDTPPSREKRESVTYDVAPCVGASGRGFDRPGDTRGQDCLVPSIVRERDVPHPLTCHQVKMGDPTTDNCIVAGCLNANGKAAGSATQQDAETGMLVTHSLRAEGFDASEDGMERGTPLVPVAVAFTTEQTPKFNADCALTITKQSPTGGGQPQCVAVAFVQNTRDEVRLMGGDGQNVGALAAEPGMKQQCYVAFNLRGREGGSQAEMTDQASLRSASGGSSRSYVAVGLDEEQNAVEDGMGCPRAHSSGGFEGSVMTPALQVRRLLPVECCRLQGFPDNYLDITINGKPAADGNKYKALGNSMAVPCMTWIGKRLQLVELFS